MKKIITLLLVLLALGTLAYANPSNIQVKEHTKKNLFVFTANKSMRGAHVQVFHSNGDLVAAQMLKKRKMKIDFCDVVEGSYMIVVVSNDGYTERFQYEKR
ncbi:MAG: hypothetical protein WDO14_08885 [Bacteroidota bacterium]